MAVDRELLLMILGEVRSLRADLLTAGVLPSPANDEDVLAAICEAVAQRTFTAPELLDHAQLANDNLMTTLTASLGKKPAPRSIGRLLARLEMKAFNGLTIRRLGTERAGIIWAVRPAG